MNMKKKLRDVIRQEAKEAIRESGVSVGLKKLEAALHGLQPNVKQTENIGGGCA